MDGRLYRSRTDAMIAGVCGGLGRYLGIDPTFVRVFFILLALSDGMGVWLYVILWFVLPREGQAEPTTIGENIRASVAEIGERGRSIGRDVGTTTPENPQAALIVGGAMIVLGVLFLLRNLGIDWLHWLRADTLWPLLLVLGGVALLWRRLREAGP